LSKNNATRLSKVLQFVPRLPARDVLAEPLDPHALFVAILDERVAKPLTVQKRSLR
jgi:hypothetical protein